jgi:CO/xanthine dehydrogenase FAD-binding subunit
LYLRPNNVDEALSALASQPWSVLAGGTDFYPGRAAQLVRDDVLDISRLAELCGVAEGDIAWRIGALTTWSDIIRSALPSVFNGLKLAARKYLVVSIASVAVALETAGQNIVTGVGIAVGAGAPVARRLTGLERKLTGSGG